MTGDEYKQLRDDLKLTQSQLAYLLNIDQSTVARRENSSSPIDTEAEISIRSLVPSKETAQPGAE